MGDFEKYVGRVTLFLPIVHVTTCGLYMAGYSAGFGGNIGGMYSPSDFFTITIQHLIKIYLFSLVFPLAFIIFSHRSGLSYYSDKIFKEQDLVKKGEMEAFRSKAYLVLVGVIIFYSVLAVLMFFLSIWVGLIPNYIITINILFALSSTVWWRISPKINLYRINAEIVWCIISFGLNVFIAGLFYGESDRRLPYESLKINEMYCGESAVLSPIGDRFLTVTPDGHRHLIDRNCKVEFDFRATSIAPKGTLFELLQEKFE